MTRLRRFLGVMAALGSLGLALPAHAAPISYTITAIASGSLGGVDFADALMTVTLVGETSAVTQPLPDDLPDLLANHGVATVTIAGLGTATFNHPDGYAAVAFPMIPGEIPLASLGIWEGFDPAAESGTGILAIGSDSLGGYDLRSPLGPVSGVSTGGATEPGGSFYEYATTAGPLVIARTGEEGTATVSIAIPVPEPASLSLFGAGALSVLAATRRRRQRQR